MSNNQNNARNSNDNRSNDRNNNRPNNRQNNGQKNGQNNNNRPQQKSMKTNRGQALAASRRNHEMAQGIASQFTDAAEIGRAHV